MKRLITSITLLALTVPAIAADMPVKAPAVQRPLIFYGGSGGYCGVAMGGEATKVAAAGVVTPGATYDAGALVGLSCGYTMAMSADRWAGVEATYARSNTSGTVTAIPGVVASTKQNQSFDLTAMYGAPLSVLSTIFSNAAAGFGALPPQAPGVNSTVHLFILAGLRYGQVTNTITDVTVPGLAAIEESHNKIRAKLGVGNIIQATNSSVVKTTAEWTFGSQNSGAGFLLVPGATIKDGANFRVMSGVYWNLNSLYGS